MRYSGWALWLAIVLLPVQVAVSPDFVNFSPSDVFLALHLMLAIRALRIVRRAWSFWHVMVIGVFLLSTAVIVLDTGRLSEYALVKKDLGIVVLLAYYLAITSFCQSWERVKWCVRSFVSSVALLNSVALTEYLACRASLFNVTWLNHDVSRLSGLFDDPNAYGSMLVVALCFHLAAEHFGRPLFSGYRRILVTCSLLLSVVLTFSRSAWLGCIPIVVALALARPSLIVKTGFAACGSIGVLVVVMGREFASFAVSMWSRSIGARLQMIRLALELFSNSPIVGVGLGYVNDSGSQIIHNTILWVIAEFGLIGLLSVGGLFSWIVIIGLNAIMLTSSTQRGLVTGALLSHLAMFCVSMGIEALYQRWWWCAMAITATCWALVRRERLAGASGIRRFSEKGNPDALQKTQA